MSPAGGRRRGPSLVLLAALVYGALAAGCVAWLGLRDPRGWGAILLGRDPLGGLAAGVALALLVVAFSVLSSGRYAWARALERELKLALGDLGGWEVLALAASSSLAEEAAFRAVLQEQAGLPVAALTFGLLHTIPRRVFLPWTAFALVMGVALGALYQVHEGALVAPVTAHFLINLINLHRIGRPRLDAPEAGTLPAGPLRV